MLIEGIRKRQRQAEYNRISKKLNEVLPLINEANIAAIELGKKIQFDTKMVKRLKLFFNQGEFSTLSTEIIVIVSNNELNYFYEWPIDKFQNRLFIIRNLMEKYYDDGVAPIMKKEDDPFWDPPTPVLIGHSYLKLEHLACQIENDDDLGIISVDGKGNSDAKLSVGYKPCTSTGETDEGLLPLEFAVDDPMELVGKKDLYFKVYVEKAKNLPDNMCSDVFVRYHFMYEDGMYHQTEPAKGENKRPTFGYEKVHCIEDITEDVANYLKKGSICF